METKETIKKTLEEALTRKIKINEIAQEVIRLAEENKNKVFNGRFEKILQNSETLKKYSICFYIDPFYKKPLWNETHYKMDIWGNGIEYNKHFYLFSLTSWNELIKEARKMYCPIDQYNIANELQNLESILEDYKAIEQSIKDFETKHGTQQTYSKKVSYTLKEMLPILKVYIS